MPNKKKCYEVTIPEGEEESFEHLLNFFADEIHPVKIKEVKKCKR